MKKQNLYVAQKAVVLKKENNKIYLLLVKYKEAPKKIHLKLKESTVALEEKFSLENNLMSLFKENA